ncbi:hypothetical protein NFI96_004706 [Prochilodus magdalenae]|nr:hypothetical protein NFI96_004706 [Prochilodus magdalenae]
MRKESEKERQNMSEVLPYEENLTHYGNDGDEEQISLTCRLQNTNNFFGTGQNKRPPKLGQIGRSKRDDTTALQRFRNNQAVIGNERFGVFGSDSRRTVQESRQDQPYASNQPWFWEAKVNTR